MIHKPGELVESLQAHRVTSKVGPRIPKLSLSTISSLDAHAGLRKRGATFVYPLTHYEHQLSGPTILWSIFRFRSWVYPVLVYDKLDRRKSPLPSAMIGYQRFTPQLFRKGLVRAQSMPEAATG